MTTIAPDVSYYQPPVNDSFTRRWLIFRIADGTFGDPNRNINNQWCVAAVKAGRMDGWTGYVVYRPGLNQAALNWVTSLDMTGGRVMIDVESWGGQIRGDHSDEINALADALAAKLGSHQRVWIYGNQGDLASIAPRRRSWLGVVVASYTQTRPTVANMVGWQYTDGTQNHTSNPSNSNPFGACDHNEIYATVLDPSGGGTPIPTPTPTPVEDEDMPETVWIIEGLGAFWLMPTSASWKVHLTTPADVTACRAAKDFATLSYPAGKPAYGQGLVFSDAQIANAPEIKAVP